MLTTYKWTQGVGLSEAGPRLEPGTWIDLSEPTQGEIDKVQAEFDLAPEFLTDPLDKDERARVEYDEDTNATLIVVRIPIQDTSEGSVPYTTIPYGIVITPNSVITVCARRPPLTDEFRQMRKLCPPYVRHRFVFNILLRAATLYLRYLREIRDEADTIERDLHKALKNGSLVDLLDLQKSLVYFTTSLNADEIMVSRLTTMRQLGVSEDDRDFLDDVVIEYRQAYEMASIHSNILTGTMDSFASVISNNLNVVMKTLTSVTIVLMVPTLIASIYGMNLGVNGHGLPFAGSEYAFAIITCISLALVALAIYIFHRRRLF
jgi:magnesium transporter